MPASKAVRPQPKPPGPEKQSIMGRFNYNQKFGSSERTTSEKGAIGTSVGKYFPVPRLAAYPNPNTLASNCLALTARRPYILVNSGVVPSTTLANLAPFRKIYFNLF